MPERDLTLEQRKLLDHFSSILPGIRKNYGVSQTVLGERVGLSRQTISSIERGAVPMSWSSFLAMAAFFSVNRPQVRAKNEMPDFNDYLQRYLLIGEKT